MPYIFNHNFIFALMLRPATTVELEYRNLFEREYNKLCKYAYTYLQDGHMAEDVVQDTFIKIWEQKKELITSDDIRYYLITAVRNNCISALRKKKNLKLHYTDATPEPEPEPFFTDAHHQAAEQEKLKQIREALNTLPPKCKEVFLLIKLHGMSYKQAAEALDISVKTVENQMGKAIKNLREHTAMALPYLVLLLKKFMIE